MEGGELGEGFSILGGEGVGDEKITRGEVFSLDVGDVGVEDRLHLGVRCCSRGWGWGGRGIRGDCHLLPLAFLGSGALLDRHVKRNAWKLKGNA